MEEKTNWPKDGVGLEGSGALMKWISTVLMGTVVGCVALQVLNRYAVHFSASWTEEVSRLLLLWVAAAGSILAARSDAHFKMDLIVSRLPHSLRGIIRKLSAAATLVFLACFAYAGVRFCLEQRDDISQMLGIPYAVPMAAIPLCGIGWAFVLMTRAARSRRMFGRVSAHS